MLRIKYFIHWLLAYVDDSYCNQYWEQVKLNDQWFNFLLNLQNEKAINNDP